MKASLGLAADVESLTHRELVARREKVRETLEEAGARAARSERIRGRGSDATGHACATMGAWSCASSSR